MLYLYTNIQSAVYFIIELDDRMINRVDYEFIDVWLNDEYEMWMRAKFQKRSLNPQRSCIDSVGGCILKCTEITERPCFKWIIRLLTAVIPIFVLVCFDQTFEGVHWSL